jgi:Zn-dependent M28 family amino/carboxypeptidase
MTDLDFEKDIVAKQPMPIQISETLTMPVILLNRTGVDMLLESAGWSPTDLNNSPPARPMGISARMQLPYTEPEPVEVVNVLGMLPGSDPNLRDEVIILGAHYDHVGHDPDLLLCDGRFITDAAEFDESNCERLPGLPYTGLVENASGVAALLEVARLWQEMGYRPRRSVLFAAWAGQETDQAGSRYYIEHPVVPLERTVSTIQLDAIGGGASFRIEGQGNWEIDGLLMLPMDLSSRLLDVRLKISGPDNDIPNDDLPFRAANIPTLFLTWQDASEDNWPDHLADEYDPAFMYISGRVLTLVLMAVAG